MNPSTRQSPPFLEGLLAELRGDDASALRELLDHLPSFFSLVDLDFRYRYVSKAYEVFFGKPRAEIENRRVLDWLGPEHFNTVEPKLRRASAGETVDFENDVPDAAGRIRSFRVTYLPMRRGDGPVIGVLIHLFDVTDIKQAAATVRRSETMLKTLNEYNPDSVIVLDADLRIQFISRSQLNINKDELIGVNVLDFVEEELRSALRERYMGVLRTGESTGVEFPIVWNEKLRWFSARIVRLPLDFGTEPSLLVVTRETTQRREKEERLKKDEERYRQFSANLSDIIWVIEFNPKRVVLVNPAFEHVTGHKMAELTEDYSLWTRLIVPEDRDRVLDHWREWRDGNAPAFNIEYRIRRRDGAIAWIHDFGTIVRDDAENPKTATGVARDITARKRLDLEQADFQKRMLETQKLESLGILAGGIAHDFNNLLGGILCNVNLAQRDLPEGEPLRTSLDQVETICLRAADLCKQMLAYAGKGRFVVAPLDLNRLIEESKQLFAVSVSKKASIHYHQTECLPAIRGDSSQLRQILLNLVINASEAFADRIGVIRIATGLIQVTAAELDSFLFGKTMPPGPCVFLEVGDNGPGMVPEVLGRIFEPFYTTKFTGRGLGLAATQGIVRSHHGAIRVASKPGRGTTFTLLLPESSSPVAPAAPVVQVGRRFFTSGEVLVVDDEQILRDSLSQALRRFGFTTTTADNGREAIDIFNRRGRDFRVVLLDLTMPVLSGEETLVELARLGSTVPVVLMSGHIDADFAERFNQHQVVGFLQKPFRVDALENILSEVLSKSP